MSILRVLLLLFRALFLDRSRLRPELAPVTAARSDWEMARPPTARALCFAANGTFATHGFWGMSAGPVETRSTTPVSRRAGTCVASGGA